MNAVQQRAHRTVTASLEERISTLELLLEKVATEASTSAGAFSQAITRAEREIERLIVATVANGSDLRAFERMGLWERLVWLVKGY